ncbi:hypothetical protein [Ruegeria sp. AU67]|uniref:hypothetical protein n=1 Tax=Ruegeria sp. AU67 TaxID=2108530 RepID=UPI00135864B6|nr:hypothetical protein [Ruegeria sp. AU67]
MQYIVMPENKVNEAASAFENAVTTAFAVLTATSVWLNDVTQVLSFLSALS